MWLQIEFRGGVRAFVNEIVNQDKSHMSAVLVLPWRGETLCLSHTHSLCSPVRDNYRRHDD